MGKTNDSYSFCVFGVCDGETKSNHGITIELQKWRQTPYSTAKLYV